jgi:hypothetical protein
VICFPTAIDLTKSRVHGSISMCLRVDDLTTAPAFFDFVYRLVADFEGHQEAEVDGRYLRLPRGWASSFGGNVPRHRGPDSSGPKGRSGRHRRKTLGRCRVAVWPAPRTITRARSATSVRSNMRNTVSSSKAKRRPFKGGTIPRLCYVAQASQPLVNPGLIGAHVVPARLRR